MPGRIITAEEKQYVLSLKPEDFINKFNQVNFELLVDLFGTKTNKGPNGVMKLEKPKFDPTDEFILNPGECNENKEKMRTTVGQLVFNKLLFGEKLYKYVGYVNKTLNSDKVRDMESLLSAALVDGEITSDDYIEYLDRFQELALGFHHVISSSFTMRGLKPIPKVIKHRDQLLKEHAEEIANGDVLAVANIERILVKEAEEILKDEPSLSLYRSGARGSMGNNYKNLSIMRGPVQNPTTGKYDTVATSFLEGISKEDIPAMGNGVIGGSYPKAVGTAVGGYKFKEISAALQAVMCDEPGTDCGSKGYMTLVITSKTKGEYLNRFIIENGKLVQLTPQVIDKYLNKPVKMRDAMYCIGDKVCAACAGEQFNKIGIKQIGLASSKVGTTMVNLGMKKFHDTSVKLYDIDLNDITI
jgi:hypothetical protein